MSTKKTGWRDNVLMIALILCAILLIGRIAAAYISNPKNFPIRHVKIMAEHVQLPQEKIASTIQDAIDNDSYLTLRSQNLEAALIALPWVQTAHVQKIWPDTLKVILTEKKVIARWRHDFVSDDGSLFRADKIVNAAALPRLNSSRQDVKEVLQVYKKMSKILDAYGFGIAVLEKRDNQAWEMILSNGIQLHLGKRDIEMRLARFCKAYPAVFEKKLDIVERIDLRYPQGMAVAWKNVQPPPNK